MKYKTIWILIYLTRCLVARDLPIFGRRNIARLFQTETRTSPSAFKNCTVAIVTTGEVCQNNWPVFDVTLANALSAKHQALYKAQIDDFDIIGLADGKIFGEGIEGETPLEPQAAAVQTINCLDDDVHGGIADNEFGHWLACKSDINCPVVRVASRDEMCNFWSFYGRNPGFADHTLTLAPYQAVDRDQFLWRQQLSEFDIAAFAHGYVSGFGYGYELEDEDTTRRNSTTCQLTEEELQAGDHGEDDWGHWLVCDLSEECPNVTITTWNDVCQNNWRLADYAAVMRDQDIWKPLIGDWSIVGYLEGYANGKGYGYEIINRGFNRLDWTQDCQQPEFGLWFVCSTQLDPCDGYDTYASAARGEYPATNRMSRIYEQDYTNLPNTFVNCTPHIATSGEVCTNRWPLYTVADINAFSTEDTAIWQAEMEEFTIAGLIDGEIASDLTVSSSGPHTLLCSNVTIDHTDEPFGHWAVCRYPECPIVRVTTTDELCNYYSYYGNNQGFKDYPLRLADVNAVVRDKLIWQSMMKDDWVAGFNTGSVTGKDGSYAITDDATISPPRTNATCDDPDNNPHDYWLVCDFSEQCPNVTITTSQDICDNNWRIADYAAVMRDQDLWKPLISDWAIVGFLEGYANGMGYGYQVVNEGFNRLSWIRDCVDPEYGLWFVCNTTEVMCGDDGDGGGGGDAAAAADADADGDGDGDGDTGSTTSTTSTTTTTSTTSTTAITTTTTVSDEPKCENTTVPYPVYDGHWDCNYEQQFCTLWCPNSCVIKKAENNPVYCWHGQWHWGHHSPKCDCHQHKHKHKHKHKKHNHTPAPMPIMCGNLGMPHIHDHKDLKRKRKSKKRKMHKHDHDHEDGDDHQHIYISDHDHQYVVPQSPHDNSHGYQTTPYHGHGSVPEFLVPTGHHHGKHHHGKHHGHNHGNSHYGYESGHYGQTYQGVEVFR